MSLTPDASHRDTGFKRSLPMSDDTFPSNSPLLEAADNNNNNNNNKRIVGEGDSGELLIEPPEDNPLLVSQPSTATPEGDNDFPVQVSALSPAQVARSSTISPVSAPISSSIHGGGFISSISSVASLVTTTTMSELQMTSSSNSSQTATSTTPEVTSSSTATPLFSIFHSVAILTPSSNSSSSVFSSSNITLPTSTSTTTITAIPSLTTSAATTTKITITTTLTPSPTIPPSQTQTPTQIEATATNSNSGVLHARTIAIIVTTTIGSVSLLAVALLVLYKKRRSLWRKATWRMRRRDSIPSDFDFGTLPKSSISAPMPYYGAEYRPPKHY